MIVELIAAIFEAAVVPSPGAELARLMEEGVRRARPALLVALLYEGGIGRLIAYWNDRGDAQCATSRTTPPSHAGRS